MSKFNFDEKKPVATETRTVTKPTMTVEGFELAKSIEKQIKDGFTHIITNMDKQSVSMETLFKKVSKLENQLETLINLIQKVSTVPAEKPAEKPANNKQQSITGWSAETGIPITKIERMIELYEDDPEFDVAVFSELPDDFDPDRGSRFISWIEQHNTLLKAKKSSDQHIVRKAEKPAAQSTAIVLPFGPSVPEDKKQALTEHLIKCKDLAELKAAWGKCRTSGIAGFTGFFCSANKLGSFWQAIENSKLSKFWAENDANSK